MKYKNLLIVIAIIMGAWSCSSTPEVKKPKNVVFDEKAEQDILIGNCKVEDFQQEPFKEWYNKEFNAYAPIDSIMKNLKENISGALKVKVVLGTWCHDSQVQVPRFFKVLEKLPVKKENISIIAVNTSKETPGKDISYMNIEKVPTFIFYLNGFEMGRIIETPQKSIEEDMLELME